MMKRTDERLGLKPERLAADTAYGTGKFLHWVIASREIDLYREAAGVRAARKRLLQA